MPLIHDRALNRFIFYPEDTLPVESTNERLQTGVKTSKKNSHRNISRAERRRHGAELDQRLRDLAHQERQARLSRLKSWLKYESVNTFLLGLFFLLLWGSTLFGIVKFYSLYFSFIEKMVNKFGVSDVIEGLFLILVLNFLLSLIGFIIQN
jgi:hypothetical protein